MLGTRASSGQLLVEQCSAEPSQHFTGPSLMVVHYSLDSLTAISQSSKIAVQAALHLELVQYGSG